MLRATLAYNKFRLCPVLFRSSLHFIYISLFVILFTVMYLPDDATVKVGVIQNFYEWTLLSDNKDQV